MTHRDLIRKLGGPVAVARKLGLRDHAALHWKDRGIPARHWIAIVALAEAADISGVTHQSVIATHPSTTKREGQVIEMQAQAAAA